MQSVSSPSACVLQYVNSSTDTLWQYRFRYWNTLWYGSLSLSISSIAMISSGLGAENINIRNKWQICSSIWCMKLHSLCSLRHSQGERHLVVGKRWMRSMALLHCNEQMANNVTIDKQSCQHVCCKLDNIRCLPLQNVVLCQAQSPQSGTGSSACTSKYSPLSLEVHEGSSC